MNIAYFMKNEADIAKLAPSDAQWVKVSARLDGSYDPADLRKLANVEALMVWSEVITQEVLAAAPNLKIIQRFGAGFDVLAPVLELTRERRIPCCNAWRFLSATLPGLFSASTCSLPGPWQFSQPLPARSGVSSTKGMTTTFWTEGSFGSSSAIRPTESKAFPL